MCIIVAKQKGIKLPTKKTLQECFKNNSDGAGLMYVKDNKVIIEKGFMSFGDFWHKIKSLKRDFNSDLTDKALVMHFRIGTHGENDKATTHPFPISGNAEDLRATYFKTDIAMAHNGIMSAYNYDKVLSDTQSFIKDYVSVFKELSKNFIKNERVVKLITNNADIKYNKLCFLDKDETIYWFGDRVIDNGIIYSNSTFKAPKYETKKYTYYNYGYNKYISSYHDYYDWDFYLEDKYKTQTLQDFINKKVKYEILQPGDFWQTGVTGDFVKPDEILLVDNKNNLYECYNNEVSLIGANATIYDKNWEVKELNFRGGFKETTSMKGEW